ncbi:hypothetical protein FQR65_LT05963 [Abscondita terminalis]|nr:hypothetical protein FQR65_LT05963 [Abscondita terminalis]
MCNNETKGPQQTALELLYKNMTFIEQFVQSVLCYSSKYNSMSSILYAPENLIGKPSKYPMYGDFPDTYLLRTYGKWWKESEAAQPEYMSHDIDQIPSEDFVTVRFEYAVFPKNVYIYETYNPGAVVRIWGRKYGSAWNLLWKGPPQICPVASRKYSPPIRQIKELIRFLHKCCKNLTHLSLDCCSFVNSAVLIEIGKCMDITDLRLRNCKRSVKDFGALALLHKLTALDLCSSCIMDEQLIDILKSNPNLKHLIIDFCDYLEALDQVAETVSIYNPYLVCWSSWKTLSFTSEGIGHLAKCSSLRELDLGWCLILNEPANCLEKVSVGCKDLRRLIISGWRGVNDHLLLPLIRSCKQLTQLDLLGIKNISSDICVRILASLPELKLLDISFCDLIKVEQFDAHVFERSQIRTFIFKLSTILHIAYLEQFKMSVPDKEYFQRCSEKTLQTNEKGFFLQFADHVADIAGSKWIKNVFGKLQSDSERIKIIYQYKPIKEVVHETLSHVQEIYRKKNAEVSQKRRKEVEKMIAKGADGKTLVLACQSVLRAPPTGETHNVDDGFTLSLAYWTRATVLMDLKKYSLALLDLQAAVREGLSDELKAEAYFKMGVCYKGKKESVCPSLTGGSHKKFPNASKKINVKSDKEQGKFVVANEWIRTGDTVVVEEPFAACLIPDAYATHCCHCFDRLVSPVGCPDCASIAFCKADCRDIALRTYHKYECHYLDLLIGSGMSILCHTALRMITQNTLEECLIKHKESRNFCTNAHLRPAEDFLQRTLMAAFLLRCLQKSNYFIDGEANDDVSPNEQELKIGEMLLYYLQVLQFNAHEIYETRYDSEHRFRTAKPAYIGVALYPTASLFNHDCYPAVSR